MSELWRKLLFRLRRRRFDRDVEEEMRFHLEMKAGQNRPTGMDAGEARFAARQRFGNELVLRETAREAWSWAPR
jgi:hypothetical protein